MYCRPNAALWSVMGLFFLFYFLFVHQNLVFLFSECMYSCSFNDFSVPLIFLPFQLFLLLKNMCHVIEFLRLNPFFIAGKLT
jgi:hypothetical protein